MKADTIIIDFDGVLTDGKINIDTEGRTLFHQVNSRDIRAIREMIALGYRVVICTASSSKTIEAYAKKVGAELEVMRDKSQIVSRFKNYIAIGDDAWDVPVIENAEKAFCPHDAHVSVKHIRAVHVCQSKGGEGVADEVLRYIKNVTK